MGPCIVNVFKHNQQDTTLHNDIYYYKFLYMFQAEEPLETCRTVIAINIIV